MPTVLKHYPAITSIEVSEDTLSANLSDGRRVSIPLAWFERLDKATSKELNNYEISHSGYGVHWPDLDEDISVKVFVEGFA